MYDFKEKTTNTNDLNNIITKVTQASFSLLNPFDSPVLRSSVTSFFFGDPYQYHSLKLFKLFLTATKTPWGLNIFPLKFLENIKNTYKWLFISLQTQDKI